jgi:hypothetical protein
MRDGATRQTPRPFHPAKAAASRVPASVRLCVNPVPLISYGQLILHAGETSNTGYALALFPKR